uniref:Uncharacterized protein n=1 Tax=Aegilops tauschii subsp. strangulata TaxID=200361 RepID=A0A453Q796_AEGTS
CFFLRKWGRISWNNKSSRPSEDAQTLQTHAVHATIQKECLKQGRKLQLLLKTYCAACWCMNVKEKEMHMCI